MCLILFGWRAHPDYQLVLAANRDEYYERPTAPAAFWEDFPGLLAGRDLRAGGTWLGVTRGGRIAAVTNYRDPASNRASCPSRGKLVTDFLLGQEAPEEFLDDLVTRGAEYNGFNLVLGDLERMYWFSNRAGAPVRLAPGVYGLSNRLLDTPWPKVELGKGRLEQALAADGKLQDLESALLGILSDQRKAADETLPETGVGRDWERILSSIFIQSGVYGTRSSTVLLASRQGEVRFIEKDYSAGLSNAAPIRRYVFRVSL